MCPRANDHDVGWLDMFLLGNKHMSLIPTDPRGPLSRAVTISSMISRRRITCIDLSALRLGETSMAMIIAAITAASCARYIDFTGCTVWDGTVPAIIKMMDSVPTLEFLCLSQRRIHCPFDQRSRRLIREAFLRHPLLRDVVLSYHNSYVEDWMFEDWMLERAVPRLTHKWLIDKGVCRHCQDHVRRIDGQAALSQPRIEDTVPSDAAHAQLVCTGLDGDRLDRILAQPWTRSIVKLTIVGCDFILGDK
jgi:hypothetical protein